VPDSFSSLIGLSLAGEGAVPSIRLPADRTESPDPGRLGTEVPSLVLAFPCTAGLVLDVLLAGLLVDVLFLPEEMLRPVEELRLPF